MPTSSYSLFYAEKFPNLAVGERISTFSQLVLDPALVLEPPKTEFILERNIEDPNVAVFRCVHEKTVARPGRTLQGAFEEFIGRYDFYSYYFEKEGLLLMKTAKDIAIGAASQIKRKTTVELSQQAIDLQSLRPLLEGFKGAYVTVDTSADVSTIALFGPAVDNDVRFKNALKDGHLFYFRIDFFANGDLKYHVGISEDQGIVLYGSKLDELSELELIMDVKRSLLDNAKRK